MMNFLIDSKSIEDNFIQMQSRFMSDPLLSDFDFKNKIAGVWTALEITVWDPPGIWFSKLILLRWRYSLGKLALFKLSDWLQITIDQFWWTKFVLSRIWIWNYKKVKNKMMKEVIQRMNQSNHICRFTLMFHPKNVYFNLRIFIQNTSCNYF